MNKTANMNGPLVSVIMPLYNKRPYVARSISSVINQSYKNWELIIVDDGSTDGSAKMVPRNDPRILLHLQTNMGPSAARNKGVRNASGDYLAFIDADDCFYPLKLEYEMGLIWKRNKAEWMMSAYDQQINGKTGRHFIKEKNGMDINKKTSVFNNAIHDLTIAGWPSDGIFMKKSLFEKLGGFNEDMRYGEITELILRCAALQPTIAISHIPLYILIDVPESTAKDTFHKREYPFQMGKSLLALGKKHPQYEAFFMAISRNYMVSYIVSLILSGKGEAARKFLCAEFPFRRDMQWWKLLASSRLPAGLPGLILNLAKKLTQ